MCCANTTELVCELRFTQIFKNEHNRVLSKTSAEKPNLLVYELLRPRPPGPIPNESRRRSGVRARDSVKTVTKKVWSRPFQFFRFRLRSDTPNDKRSGDRLYGQERQDLTTGSHVRTCTSTHVHVHTYAHTRVCVSTNMYKHMCV